MFSWLKRSSSPNDPQQAAELYRVVRAELKDSDEDSVTIVASIAAVLLCIAYADCDYDSREEAVVRLTLERMHGIDEAGVSAIMTVLNAHTVRITVSETNILRDVTKAMGLNQAQYLTAQSAHRDKLAVLKKARA
jgi:uncharacterized tellurite resistance protein B-like protein